MAKRRLFIILTLCTLFAASVHAAVDDPDSDGIPNSRDNCDNIFNPSQTDSDGDGVGDACEGIDDPDGPYQCGYPPINGVNDPDGDSVPNGADNCVCAANPSQTDSDGDNIGNACDTIDDPEDPPNQCGHVPINGVDDPDGDGVPNSRDNCDCDFNPGQEDSDSDGIGDACDTTTPPPTGNAQYRITKSVDRNTAHDNEEVLYTVRITNLNNEPGNVLFTDKFSYTDTLYSNGAALTFIPNEQITGLNGVTHSGTLSGNGITFTNIRQSNGPVTITYRARASTPNLFSGSATITNEASLSNGQSASAAVNILPTTIGQGQLTVSKAVSDTTPAHGDVITYTITVRNTGNAPVSEARVYDTIGSTASMTLRGFCGNYYCGRVTALGTQTVAGSYDPTTSILSPRGLRLLNIAAGSTTTISYPARVDTSDMGSSVTAAIYNTASLPQVGDASARVDLTGVVVPPPPTPGRSSPPFILPIPTQVQTCGLGFDSINLNNFVSDPDTPNSDLSFSVDGNRRFQAHIDPDSHILTVTDPSGVQDGVSENIRLTVRDPEGNIATRTLLFSVLRTTFGKPIISGIPDQIVRKNRDFDEFDLDEYTQIGGTPLSNRTVNYYAVGSTLFDVQIDENNRVSIEYDDDLFLFTDADQISEEVSFVMRGCSEAKDTAIFTVMREIPGTVIPQPPGEHTCVIVPRSGVQIKDTDCDGVPDTDDNCPTVKNPDQRDQNRNGLGDACDVQIFCEPSVSSGLDSGKALQVRVGAQNNMPSQSTTARYSATISKLGVSESRTTAAPAPGEIGESMLRLRLPECAPAGRYTLTCNVQMSGHTSSESRTIEVQPSERCISTDDGSGAQFFEMQDVITGSPYGASFPVVIMNNGDQQRSYVLEVDGILPWGDYIFEGGSVVIVPAGQTTTTNLRVYALPQAIPDTYPFKVTMRSGDDLQETFLRATVVPDENLQAQRGGVRAADLLWLLVIVVVFGAILFGSYRATR